MTTWDIEEWTTSYFRKPKWKVVWGDQIEEMLDVTLSIYSQRKAKGRKVRLIKNVRTVVKEDE